MLTRQKIWLLAAGFAVGFGSFAFAEPASAHVFSLAVVFEGDERTDPAAQGLRMAIDESPDVSHPPGREGGDHLGGIDVDLQWISSGRRDTVQKVKTAIDSGTSAVVILSSSRTSPSIITVVQTRGRLALVVTSQTATNNTATNQTVVSGPGVIVLRSTATVPAFARVTAFRAGYRSRFGAAANAASFLGYDSGRLVDLLVTEVGAGLEPDAAVAVATRTPPDVFLGSTIVAPARVKPGR